MIGVNDTPAEILQLSGAWPEAIETARRVSERECSSAERPTTADPFYQQAEIHRLRGEFAASEKAYR